MINSASLSDDSFSIVLLCSHVACSTQAMYSPLSLSEWNTLAPRIQESALKTPGGLLGIAAETLQRELHVTDNDAGRLAALLDRGAAAALELENWISAGIRICTLIDPEYPQRLKDKLKSQAPPSLFYSGPLELADKHGIAIVGSRNIDHAAQDFAALLASQCARHKINVVSGGARGVDVISMKTALEEGGASVGVASDSHAAKIREQETRKFISEERFLLLSPFHPKATFQVANAMSRNKVIYALSDYAVVVASELDKGGTWSGALENLRKNYAPLFVRTGEDVPEGNRALLKKNAIGLSLQEIQAEIPDLLSLFQNRLDSTSLSTQLRLL